MEKFINIIGFTLLIISIFVFGLKGMSVEMGISVTASSIFLAFANLNKFAKFKGAGFEAELKQVVDEANATIENLKEVAKPLIQTNLVTLTKAGRFEEDAFNQSHDLYDQLNELQKKMGLKSDDLEISKSEYLNIHAWDMVYELSSEIEKCSVPNFLQISRDTLGVHNFKKAPDIKKFHALLSDLKLNEENKKQLQLLNNYYDKYKL